MIILWATIVALVVINIVQQNEKSSLEEVLDNVFDWQSATFDTTPEDAISGLIKEAEELRTAGTLEAFLEENVDVLFYAFYIARKKGYSLQQIKRGMEMKLQINRNRSWLKRGDNCYQHVEPTREDIVRVMEDEVKKLNGAG